jgi:hypothetical protein
MPISHFQPPPPNDLPPPAVPPALNKGTGTRSIGDRLRFWRALALLGGALWAVPYVAVKALSGGWPAADVLWWAGGVGGLLTIGVAWVALTFAQDVAQFRAMRALWGLQLSELGRNGREQRRALRGHTARWGGKRHPKPETTVINGVQAQQQAQAAQREVAAMRDTLAALDAQIAAIQAQSKARVADGLSSPYSASPDPVDLDTRELPPSGPVAAAYFGGPAHRIVAMALRHESISSRALVPRWMTRAQEAAAKAQLSGAGVLVKEGQGWALAADLAGRGEDAAHAEVVKRLVAKET